MKNDKIEFINLFQINSEFRIPNSELNMLLWVPGFKYFYLKRFRFLCSMRMFSRLINVKFSIHIFTKFIFRKHSSNCMLNNTFRIFLHPLTGWSKFSTTRITCVMEIFLLLEFSSCEDCFFSIDNYNIITGISMRSPNRLILST